MNIRLLAALSAAVLTSMAGVPADAQSVPGAPPAAAPSKAATPKAPPKAPPKQQAAPTAPTPATPPIAAGQTSAPTQGAQLGDQAVQLVYTPWAKVCFKAPEAGPKDYCIVGKSGLLESGQPVISGLIVTVDGEPRRILRVMFPLGMLLPAGTQLYVDSATPQQQQYLQCLPNGCYADYEATNELVAAMKAGQNLVARAYNANNVLLTVQLPLAAEFTKAFDGPATDPKVMEQQQKDMETALQKKAEEARQRLQQAAPAPAAPAK